MSAIKMPATYGTFLITIVFNVFVADKVLSLSLSLFYLQLSLMLIYIESPSSSSSVFLACTIWSM